MSVQELNDKPAWWAEGRAHEEDFVRLMSCFPGPEIRINPAKEQMPTLPDLLDGPVMADLKTQTKPFFRAAVKYDLDPYWTVSYNREDYEYYAACYPQLRLYFWIRREPMERFGIKVGALHTVRVTSADMVAGWIESGYAPEHTYLGRVDDKAGNAKSSFLLDLTAMEEVITFRGRS